MRRRRQTQQRILFPWDVRVGVLRWLLLGRFRSVLAVGGVVAFIALVAIRERAKSGERQTRAAIYDVRHAVDAYMAEHDGGCPGGLDEVAPFAKHGAVPRDAWGRTLRITCPSRQPGIAYELASDGPDGVPGGLDRIE
jgi:general secretion pathway protein G